MLEGIRNSLLLLTADSGGPDDDKGKVDYGHVILCGGNGQTNHGWGGCTTPDL
jgi:hypothetical protein